MMIDFCKYRSNFTWLIRETDQCIFHIDSLINIDNDINDIIIGTENRYKSIMDILHFDINSIKVKEKRHKNNYWLFSPKLFSINGINPNDSFKGTGSASASGIDYVIYNDRWNNHIEHILHEEIHLLVISEIGEAPSLLNEGIAVYTELMICKKKEEYIKKYFDVWKNNILSQKGILRQLMVNEYFWNNFGKLPLYTIGAAFVYFFIVNFGIESLKDIFEKTHFHDENLYSIIEKKNEKTNRYTRIRRNGVFQ